MGSIQISIHAPAKGATRTYPVPEYSEYNFNPRSREGSDENLRLLKNFVCKISIHAPAKGATTNSANFTFIPRISIHAPAKGATNTTDQGIVKAINFNPRSREGSDLSAFLNK